jgi:hypothetical protein
MRYKNLVSKKLEGLESTLSNIKSLLSQPNTTRPQFEQWFELMSEKIKDIEALINSENQA